MGHRDPGGRRAPPPIPSGLAESFTVSGLDPSTTYYFAVKVIDNVGNESRIYDVVSAATVAGTVVFQDDMENGANGWTTDGSDGLWHQDSILIHSPSTAWWYGKENQYTYNTGGRNWGTLTSPAIDLANASDGVLTFYEFSEVEVYTSYDRTRVQVSTDGATWVTVFESHRADYDWEKRTVDLRPYVGGDLYIRFWFDTIDESLNNYLGWFVDGVTVTVAEATVPPADTTPPATPSDLGATAGDGQVSLDWTDNTEADLAGYDIHRSTISAGSYSQIASQVAGSEYTDADVTNGTTYYYTVTAVDGDGNQSRDSDEASGTPEAEAEPTPEPTPPASANAMYVWDIYFDSRTKGKGGKTHDERVTVVVRWDSDGDGLVEESDELVPGATVTLTLTGPGLDAVYSGDTGVNKKTRGVYSTDWMGNLADGDYTAEVTGLTHADYAWDGALDPAPNQQHAIPH